jgi:hypothetical protein
LYAASKAAEGDPQKAMAILQSGTATMRSLAKDMLAAQHAGAQVSNQGLHYQRADANDAARTAIAAKAAREISPEDAKLLNGMSAKISAEQDPARQRQMMYEYQRVYGIALAKIGKVVNPAIEKAAKPDITFVEFMELYGDQPVQRTPNGKPMKLKEIPPGEAFIAFKQFSGSGDVRPTGGVGSDFPSNKPYDAKANREGTPGAPPSKEIRGLPTPDARPFSIGREWLRRADIEAAAKNGNPRAIKALEVLNQNDLDLEMQRSGLTPAY